VLNLAGIAVDALSIGGLETCIQLPGLDLAFDMGTCPPSAVHRSTVCFTHAHIDHMGGVAHHCATRALTRLDPPTYLVPAENVEAFHDLLAVWRRLDRSELDCRSCRWRPRKSTWCRPGLVAIPFRSPHRVPCIGYALWEERNKLKPELQRPRRRSDPRAQAVGPGGDGEGARTDRRVHRRQPHRRSSSAKRSCAKRSS
jgi:ribonuclease Z